MIFFQEQALVTDSIYLFFQKIFSPITTTSPASEFWGINQSILYGTTIILAETAGVVDTGKSALLILW